MTATQRAATAIGYHWSPSEGLTDAEQRMKLTDLDHVVDVWKQVRADIDPKAVAEFNRRLTTHIAIETGILEGLYTVGRGLTLSLIEHGLASDIMDSSTEPMAATTLALIKDQLESSTLIMDVVGGARPLSKSFIKELQALLTRNQQTTRGRDQFGRILDVPLLHGAFKVLANNPTRPDGLIHEYAPPEHVEAEMDVLLRRHATYSERDIHPVVLAAWLHHRFTQIHPFQDGNGRVARLLASMICIKGHLFPLRIVREDRDAYVDALEAADHRDLSALIELFANVEKSTILEAMRPDASFGIEVGRPALGLTQQVAARIAQRLHEKEDLELEERRKVNAVASELQKRLLMHLDTIAKSTEREFAAQRIPLVARTDWGGPENGKEHWWRYQVIHAAHGKHFANLSEKHYWLRLAIDLARTELTFVVSIHHVGRPVTGVMAVMFVAEVESLDTPRPVEGPQERKFISLGVDSIPFTVKDSVNALTSRIMPRLDQAVALALRDLGNTVV